MVKTGDIVKVKVLEVDPARSRIALTMILSDSAEQKASDKPRHKPSSAGKSQSHNKANRTQANKKDTLPPGKTGTMADLFANAKTLKKK